MLVPKKNEKKKKRKPESAERPPVGKQQWVWWLPLFNNVISSIYHP